jgi:hypothetical protein
VPKIVINKAWHLRRLIYFYQQGGNGKKEDWKNVAIRQFDNSTMEEWKDGRMEKFDNLIIRQ